jgi:hypothetical protein
MLQYDADLSRSLVKYRTSYSLSGVSDLEHLFFFLLFLLERLSLVETDKSLDESISRMLFS